MYGENRERRSGGFQSGGGNRFGNDRGGNFVPVKVGDEIDVKIEAVGEKGDGVAKVKGFVVFVPNVKEGEMARIRVTKVLRKVGFGEKIGEAQGAPASSAPAPTRWFSSARPSTAMHPTLPWDPTRPPRSLPTRSIG